MSSRWREKISKSSASDQLEEETKLMELRLKKLKEDMEAERKERNILGKIEKQGAIWKNAKQIPNGKSSSYIDQVMNDIQRKEREAKEIKKKMKVGVEKKEETAEKGQSVAPSGSLWGTFDESNSHSGFVEARSAWISGTTSVTEMDGSSSLLNGNFDEAGGHNSFAEARNQWLQSSKSVSNSIGARVDKPTFANSLLYGNFDEVGGHEAFSDARKNWLNQKKIKVPVVEDATVWNVQCSQVTNDEVTPSNMSGSCSNRVSCYNCYKLFLMDTGILDPASNKIFCSEICVDQCFSSLKLICTCRKTFFRKDSIKTNVHPYFFCSEICSNPKAINDKILVSDLNPLEKFTELRIDNCNVGPELLRSVEFSYGTPFVEEPDD